MYRRYQTNPTIDDDICGYETYPFEVLTDVTCDDLGTGVWTMTDNPVGGSGQVRDTLMGMYYVKVDLCGYYEFTYTVWNGGVCEGTHTIGMTFHEQPNPTIEGSANVFACATDVYTTTDGRECTLDDELTWTWDLDPELGELTNNGDGTASIEWYADAVDETTTLSVEVCIDVPQGVILECCASAEFEIEVGSPTLAGQVKYWNEFETYMPTPLSNRISTEHTPCRLLLRGTVRWYLLR
ncbi:MAG: hypothetical protein U5Q03_01950 [Bacteroidota bacterium]|nr:hypothetical protein [Bacteroidota bacterium]